MTTSAPHHAALNASQELRELVGIRWALGKIDLQRAQEDGLDCLGLMVAAYTIIGRHLGEPDLWRFPIPLGFPYDAELPEGGWLPEDDIAEWSRHFTPTLVPVFGAAVTLNADHIGVLIEPARVGGGLHVLHAHKKSGVVLHPLARISRWATGFYTLRRIEAADYAESDAAVTSAATTTEPEPTPKMVAETARQLHGLAHPP